MEFTRETLAAEVDREYSGLVLSDADGGPLTIRSPLRLPSDTLRRINKMDKEVAGVQEGEDVDFDQLRALLIDRLALAADRPQDLRNYVDTYDVATLKFLNEKWNEATQGGALAQ